MAPHGPTSETSWPAKASPDRPYDWAAPYDWEVEGVFRPERPDTRLSTSRELRNTLFAGTAMVAAMTALIYGYYEAKKTFFALDAQAVPAKLPPTVRSVAASAVKVEYNTDLSIGGSGSGVKIGPDLVLTAGHVVLEDNERDRLSCKGSYVLNTVTPGYDRGVEGVDWIVNQQAVDNDSEDMAVLRVWPGDSFTALPTAQIAANQPSKGEPVFFINYEGGAGPDSNHYPNAELVQGSGSETEKIYGHAAQYAGIVIGREDSDLLVATGQRGYGPKAGREVDTYPGASGGPVFNRAGKVVGEVVASYSEREVSVTLAHGVNLPRHGSTIPISVVQPVTKDTLQPLIDDLPESPAC